MPASIATPEVDELDDPETRPMTDAEHRAVFGWAWDDPNVVEVEA